MPHKTIAPVKGCRIQLRNRFSYDFNFNPNFPDIIIPDIDIDIPDFDFDFDFPGFGLNQQGRQGILFLIDSSGSMAAGAAIAGIWQAYDTFDGKKMSLFGLDLYGGSHATICKQVDSIEAIISSARTIPFGGSGDDAYPFQTLMSYASTENVYKYIAVIGDEEFTFSEYDSAALTAAYSQYDIIWQFFRVPGNIEPSFSFFKRSSNNNPPIQSNTGWSSTGGSKFPEPSKNNHWFVDPNGIIFYNPDLEGYTRKEAERIAEAIQQTAQWWIS